MLHHGGGSDITTIAITILISLSSVSLTIIMCSAVVVGAPAMVSSTGSVRHVDKRLSANWTSLAHREVAQIRPAPV